jgi:general stress protein 26
MGDTKNLVGREAVDKIKDIAGGQTGMLCTFTTNHAMETRPMATQAVDADGTLWFFSSRDSAENQQILANPAIQLIYAVPSKTEFLSLEGTASISRDQRKIDELWSGWAKTWFTGGKEDPSLTLITVTVTGGRYWDTKHGKMASIAKIAVGAVTGKTMDDGIKGSLRV